MVTFKNTLQDPSLRVLYDAERQKQREKWYFAIRAFIRDTEDIAQSRKWLDAYAAEFGHSQYSNWLEETLKQVVSYANDKSGYNQDGTPKQRIVMGGKTYFVQFGDWYYGEMHNVTERSITLTDSVSGKSWHWQIVAWIERETPNAAYGRMWRTIFLNGAFYQESNYGFGARLNPMMPTYSDPRQVILSFLSEAERLTKQMNQE